MKIIYFYKKDAHRFTDLFASPEMLVRVDFEGVNHRHTFC